MFRRYDRPFETDICTVIVSTNTFTMTIGDARYLKITALFMDITTYSTPSPIVPMRATLRVYTQESFRISMTVYLAVIVKKLRFF